MSCIAMISSGIFFNDMSYLNVIISTKGPICILTIVYELTRARHADYKLLCIFLVNICHVCCQVSYFVVQSTLVLVRTFDLIIYRPFLKEDFFRP